MITVAVELQSFSPIADTLLLVLQVFLFLNLA